MSRLPNARSRGWREGGARVALCRHVDVEDGATPVCAVCLSQPTADAGTTLLVCAATLEPSAPPRLSLYFNSTFRWALTGAVVCNSSQADVACHLFPHAEHSLSRLRILCRTAGGHASLSLSQPATRQTIITTAAMSITTACLRTCCAKSPVCLRPHEGRRPAPAWASCGELRTWYP